MDNDVEEYENVEYEDEEDFEEYENYESNRDEIEMMNNSDEEEYIDKEFSKRSSKDSEIKYSIKEMSEIIENKINEVA